VDASLGLPSDRKGSTIRSARALGLVLAALFVVGLPARAVGADTTLNSGTTTVSTGKNFGDSLYVATTGTATLEVIAGGYATNTRVYLGYDPGSSGVATVSGSGTWTNSTELDVGSFGTGTLIVTGGSILNGAGYIGRFAGSIGEATVSGGTWSNGGSLVVGQDGTGTLNLNGGLTSSAVSVLGFNVGGVGTATLSSGTWANSGDLCVGLDGTGTLNLNGGLVSVAGTLSTGTSGTINLNAGGTLQIGVGGTTGVLGVSTLTNNGTLIFNRSDASTYSGMISGTGAVTKQGAGMLTFDGANSYSGGTTILSGTVSVVTGGSIDQPNANVIVGQSGGDSGSLNVIGGLVNNSRSYLGYDAGSNGTATVSSGTWASSHELYVGSSGTGSLTISGSSVVTNGSAYLGSDAGSNGTATISSGTWSNSGGLLVGIGGTGTLNVSGGSVTSANIAGLGFAAGSLGTATVSGGTWANSGEFYVGYSGTGVLAISGSGVVTNSNAYVGYDAGSVGTATVSSGTTTSGNLAVGSSGTGTLTMSGGLVTVGSTLSQGTYGTINLNSGGTLQIGVGGTTGVLGVSTLTNNGTLIFNRSDASTYSGIISGTGAVKKQGGGTLTFTGTSSYTGATHIDGGSLLVNGQLGNTAVTVNASGLLGGSGTILGDVTVDSSGTMSPGNSPGILTVGSLSLLAGSTTLMEITGTAAGLYDQIVAMNNIAYGGLLQLTISGSYTNDTVFQLFQFGSESGDFSSLTVAGGSGPFAGLTFGALGTGGYGADAWVSDWTTPNAPNGQRLVFFQNNGTLVVVPEPSTYAMSLAGLALGGWQMLRRRRLRQAPPLAA